ncbi:hypothetical protein TcCL_Unassigned04939 [Trypanosoma cruzi]|nr:hypothetical protein TcCL_Unassigned04939 [Trypanosoma cruzi]
MVNVAGGVSEESLRKEEWHAFGGAAVRSVREEEKHVISDASVSVPRPPMSSQGEEQEGGRRRPCASAAACGATGCGCHCELCDGRHACSRASSASLCPQSLLMLRGGAGDLSSLDCWGSFPLCSAGGAALLARGVLFCINNPHVLSRRRAVAVQLSCFSLHAWLHVAWLICRAMACGPPLGGQSHVFLCVLLRGTRK